MSYRVLVTTSPATSSLVRALAPAGFDLDVRGDDLGPDELVDALDGKDAYVLGGVENVGADVLARVPDLKVLAFLGVGYAGFVDTDAATRHGVAVTNAPGSNAAAVAELTVGLMLDLTRRVTWLANGTKAGRWPSYRARGLTGATLGIVGLGAIGTRVATIARQAFGMEVVYHSRRRRPEVEQRLGVRYARFGELLAGVDVLSLHAAFGPDTAGMVDAAAFDRLPDHAVLVNTGEAELVDPAALRAALVGGQLAGAAFDGYYVEPVPGPEDDPYGLVALPDEQFLVLPHTGAVTGHAFATGLGTNLRSIRRILDDGTDEHLVNPDFVRHARWHPFDHR